MGNITRTFANNITTGGKFDATDLTGTLPASNVADASVTNITDVPALVATTTVASDPPSPDNGQMWYNSTDRVLRGYVQLGSWATGGNMNTGRFYNDASGTQTSSLVHGGERVGDNPAQKANTEEYNGSSWTEVNDFNTNRQAHASAGANAEACLAIAGYSVSSNTTNCELWDGTNWTEVNNINTARRYFAGDGISTSAIAFGGGTFPPNYRSEAESWDGTNWTEVGDLNTARYSLGGSGTSNTSALAWDGNTGSGVAICELWDGTSWTEVADVNTQRYSRGSGSSTLTVTFGGAPSSGATELWDGTTWTETNDMSTGREGMAASGGGNSALASGGTPSSPQSNLTATEEWTKTEVVTTLGAS